jgi:spore germination protein
MLSANQKISLRQLQILIIVNALGTGLIVLPKRAAEYAAQDGWLVVIGLVLLAMILGALIITAAGAAANAGTSTEASFIELTKRVFPKPMAYLFAMGLFVKLILNAGLEMRVFATIVRQMLLQNTPLAVISGVMLAVCAYSAAKGIETRARAAEVLLVLLAIIFIIFLTIAFLDVDFSNLRPVAKTPPGRVLSGVAGLGYIFTGLECLLLITPYMKRNNNHQHQSRWVKNPERRGVVMAIAVAGGFITLLTLLTIAKFGPHELPHQPWPVLRLMSMVTLPGSFVARQDALVMSFWIISVFALCNMFLYFSALLARDIMKNRGKHKYYVWGCAAAVLAVACLPIYGEQIYRWMDSVYMTFGIFYLFIFPLLLLGSIKIKKLKMPALLLALLLATGCWDSVEIKDRAFAMAIGIDRAEDEDNRYAVSLAIPALKQGEKEAAGGTLKKAEGKTVTEALCNLETESPQIIYLGQAKLILLGEGIVKDAELFRGLMDALDKNTEIDRQLLVAATTDKIGDILDAKEQETMPGLGLAEILKNESKTSGVVYKQNFANLCAQMRQTGHGIIPVAGVEDSEIRVSGAMVIKNFKKAGDLDETEIRGFLWSLDKSCEGTVITVEADGKPVPFTAERHKADIRFAEADGLLRCLVDVRVTGRLKEYSFGEAPHSESTRENIIRCLEQTITDEILRTAGKMQLEYGMDGYNWLEDLRKKRYDLYKRYAADWERVFAEMEVAPKVRVAMR